MCSAILIACSGGEDGLDSGGAASSSGADGLSSAPGWVIGAPPEGYELCALSLPTVGASPTSEGPHLQVYADLREDDPYAGPLLGVAVFDAAAPGDFLADHEVVDVGDLKVWLGPADGFQLATLPSYVGSVATWEVGDGRVVQMVGRAYEPSTLLELVPEVVVEEDRGRIPLGSLPDGTIDLGDVYASEGRATFRFSLDYELADADRVSDQLTLLGTTGDRTAMEAFRFRAGFSERRTINGADGVVADIGSDGDGPWVVTWMADDGLILRLFSFVRGIDELAGIAESVAPAGTDQWADIADRFDPPVCGRRG